ncbi:hypothetical protein LTR05_008561 [Lithohypha guttulata]|uniref:Methyltransferase n=1 Tax=Lithohypha guttulata TaxID=1690604 RepID=A0AAN7PJV9_9EURO|nr:hypothetical protein LTR05_008561 [Lithohypha guttulata]
MAGSHHADLEDEGFHEEPCETRSADSTIWQPLLRYGRRYHRYHAGKYMLPEDEEEQDRLDLQHEIFLRTFDQALSLAPLPSQVFHVLDLGTGTGLWAMGFADAHSEAEVRCVDLSPIQPVWVPPNCHFDIDDFEDPWIASKYDYVHGRMLLGSIQDLSELVNQAYQHLLPGGWIEFQDGGPIISQADTLKDTHLQRWMDLMTEAAARRDRHLDVVWRYEEALRAAGFHNVTQKQFLWPINTWPKDKHYKELGYLVRENMLQGLHGFSAHLLQGELQLSSEEMEAFLADVRKDISNRKIHAYMPIIVVYGQKPF